MKLSEFNKYVSGYEVHLGKNAIGEFRWKSRPSSKIDLWEQFGPTFASELDAVKWSDSYVDAIRRVLISADQAVTDHMYTLQNGIYERCREALKGVK